MARPPNKGSFKKGNKGGPGRPSLSEEQRHLAKLTKKEVGFTLSCFMKMTVVELEEILKDKNRPTIEHWTAKIVLTGIESGDHQRMNFMLERLVGKVKDEVEHTVKPRVVENLEGGETIMITEKVEE